MKTKTICISTVFPASVEVIWAKLQKLSTLQYITAPYMTFKPINNISGVWKENSSTDYNLKLFTVIPFGVHTIKVIQFDKTTLSVYTNETSKFIPVWNHRIVLKKLDNGFTLYTDIVEIKAGWKTIFIYLWGNLFYRHRQRKWLNLLK